MNPTPSQTLRIVAALAWEFWASRWRGILLAPLGAIALPGLVFGMISWDYGASLHDKEVDHALQFNFFWLMLVFLGAPVLNSLANPTRRYTLPVSSFVSVAVPMACAMVTIFAEYALVAIVLDALFDTGWPIWGPGLLAAFLIAWCQAILWWHPLLILASVVPLLFAINQWAPPFGSSLAEFLNVTVWRAALFGVAAMTCVVVGTSGFANRRHGSEIDLKRIFDGLRKRFRYWTARREATFSSPTAAQFWLEWTERGYVLPVVTAFLGIAALVLAWLIPLSERGDFVRGVSAFFFAPCFVIGIFWGSRSPQLDFGNFNGTRPLSDAQVAQAILKSATLGVILSSVMWAVCMTVVVMIIGEDGAASRLFRSVEQIGTFAMLARVALGAVAVWSAVGLLTSLVLAGTRVFSVGFSLVIAMAMAGALLPVCLPRESRAVFAQAYLLACLALCLLVFAAVFVASWRHRLISLPALGLAAGLVVAALTTAHAGGLTHEWKYLLPVACGCGLIPIPLAAAPLAVFVNRHS